MPFTVAHPVAVAPLLALRSPWVHGTALVAGSIAPDFEYFLNGRMHGSFAHTGDGLFLFSWPAAVVLVVVYHLIVEPPLRYAFPEYFLAIDGHGPRRPWFEPSFRRLLGLFASAFLGCLTHVTWDSFTHRRGFFVQHVASLRATIELPLLGQLTAYRAVQHLSTACGLLLLAAWAALAMARRSGAVAKPPLVARFAYLATIATGAAGFLSYRVVAQGSGGWSELGNYVVACISGGLLGLLTASLCLLPRAAVRRQSS